MTTPPSRRDRAELEAELGLHREELIAQNEDLLRANAELTAARGRLAVVLDAAPTGYAALDDRGRIVQANRTLATLFETERESLVGRPFDQALRAADRPRLRRYLEAIASDGTPSTCDLALASDGEAVVHVVGAAVPASADDVVRIVLAVTDESERRRLQAQRDAAEARLAELGRLDSLALMAAGVAHDFNNLLAIVLAQLTLIRVDAPAESAVDTAAAHAMEAAERAAALSKQLLAYTGQGRIELRPTDLCSAVRGIEGLLRSSVAGRATIHLEIAREPLMVMGDETQLNQVVMNLVLNAAEAMLRPGTVTVRTRAEPLRVVLEVADDGRGMDRSIARRVFDPFYSTKAFGRGLGLSVVQGHVKAHGGTVGVDSAPGEGTTVRVSLPSMGTDRTGAHRWRGQGAVLIVDDEALLRGALGLMVRSLGFVVYEAGDGMEALEVLPTIREPVAAVLLDVMMPRMDGGETLAALRARGACPPVIVMSGYRREDTRRASSEADAFLEKPFTMSALKAALQLVTEERAAGADRPEPQAQRGT